VEHEERSREPERFTTESCPLARKIAGNRWHAVGLCLAADCTMPLTSSSPRSSAVSAARRIGQTAALVVMLTALVVGASTEGGPLPGPLPLFPANNWWNVDVSTAPIDVSSASYISFIGATRTLHPDFGGDVSAGSAQVYGFPYAVVDGTTPLKTVQFQYADESDGVNHATNTSIPFYPIPDEAITQAHWIESGEPGNVDLRNSSDRHLLIVDRDHK
jgi:hypothetical protein